MGIAGAHDRGSSSRDRHEAERDMGRKEPESRYALYPTSSSEASP